MNRNGAGRNRGFRAFRRVSSARWTDERDEQARDFLARHHPDVLQPRGDGDQRAPPVLQLTVAPELKVCLDVERPTPRLTINRECLDPQMAQSAMFRIGGSTDTPPLLSFPDVGFSDRLKTELF